MGRLDSKPLLEVKTLTVDFHLENRTVHAVKGISFSVAPGEVVCLVGESGSGKTVTGMSIPRLVPSPPAEIQADGIVFDGKDLLNMKTDDLRKLRGSEIGCIFQEPMTALSPLHRVGDQLIEALQLHQPLSRKKASQQAVEMLTRVGIPDPQRRMNDYPYQYSGGMRQRVMIAQALIMEPKLIIADEPTTALDVTTQAQIFELMRELKSEQMSMLFITHDMGVVWELADRVLVMKDGELIEEGDKEKLFKSPQHEYTKKLLSAVPRLTAPAYQSSIDPEAKPLLEVRNLQTWFPIRKGFLNKVVGHVKAVDDVSLKIAPASTVALVGESGSGKSTLGRTILQLESARGGEIFFDGQILKPETAREILGRRVQVIFQDPYSSLNPRMTVRDLITEPLRETKKLTKEEVDQEATRLLEEVDLEPEMMHRFPHEFSGGQRQRICIARSLSVHPELIICDEAVSSLDVTLQAQVIKILQNLQQKHGIAYLFISHDLALVKQIADEVLVMKEGKIVESGTPKQVIDHPQEDYTRNLLAAVPSIPEGDFIDFKGK